MSLTPSQIQILKDNASLILAPSAPYGVGGFQAIKPFTEAGRFDFSRTTGKYVDKAGGLTWVPENVPAVDSNGALVFEPARTNLALWSEDFTAGSWQKIGAPIVTANQGTSPNGTLTADRVQFPASTRLFQVAAAVAGVLTVWMKSFDGSNYSLRLRDNTGTQFKDVTVTPNWQRFELIMPSGAITNYQIERLAGASADVLLWGAQFESGSYATSYIPTAGAAATRTAETINGAQRAADKIGQTEGFIFCESLPFLTGFNMFAVALSDGTSANRILISFNNTNFIRFYVASSGVFQTNPTGVFPFVANTYYKICLTYKSNEWKLFVNGALITTSLSGLVPLSMNRLAFDAGNFVPTEALQGKTNVAAIGKTALSEADAITLTR